MSHKIQVVKFSAVWCGPCKKYTPIFKNFAKRNPGVEFVEVDVDNDPQGLNEKFDVRSLPTTVVIKGGVVTYKIKGILLEEQLAKLIG